jgi:hypothetical protein
MTASDGSVVVGIVLASSDDPARPECRRYGASIAYRVVAFRELGLILKRRWVRESTVAYSAIMTAERLPWRWGLRLHVHTGQPLRIASWHGTTDVEDELRRRGVRIVDEYGAIIAPTLAEFERELANEPVRLRQSSDNA